MKKIRLGIPLMLGIFALLILGWTSQSADAAPSADAASTAVNAIFFDPPFQEVQVGDKFTVTVRTDMGELHNAVQMLLRWNKNFVELDGGNVFDINSRCNGCSYEYEEVLLVGPRTQNSITLADNEALGVFSADSFIGNSTVAQLIFRAVAPTNGAQNLVELVQGQVSPNGVQRGTLFANSTSAARAFEGNGSASISIQAGQEINLTVVGGIDNFKLDWTQTSPFVGNVAHSHYRIYRRHANNAEQQLSATPTNGNYVDNDPALQQSELYCYRIEAVNGNQVIGESNQVCKRFGVLQVVAARQTMLPNATQEPLLFKLLNGSGLCIGALDLEFNYDKDVIRATGWVSNTSHTTGYSFRANTSNEGTVKISAISGQCRNLSGEGGIFNVYFDAIGANGKTVTSLNLVGGNSNTVIYDDGDLFTPLPLELVNGLVELGVDFIRGDCTGTDGVNSADALFALQVANDPTIATIQQLYACDVNGDSVVNSADSALIQCFVVERNWDSPICKPGSGRHVQNGTPATVTLNGTDVTSNDATTTISIALTDAADFAGGTFSVNYNPAETRLIAVRTTALTNGFLLDTNLGQDGLARISLANASAIAADGVILELEFETIACTDQPYAVQVSSAHLNDQYGRDFATNLDREVQLVHQTPTCVTLAIDLSTVSAERTPQSTMLVVGLLLVAFTTLHIYRIDTKQKGETHV